MTVYLVKGITEKPESNIATSTIFFMLPEVPLVLESFGDDHNEVIFHVSIYIFLTRGSSVIFSADWKIDC